MVPRAFAENSAPDDIRHGPSVVFEPVASLKALFDVFGVPGFAGLWLSAAAGSFARLMVQLVLSWITLESTGSPFLVGVVLAVRMMLEHLDQREAAERVERAVVGTLADGRILTPDLGGRATTAQVTDAIIDRL